jgi:hypothetical protein
MYVPQEREYTNKHLSSHQVEEHAIEDDQVRYDAVDGEYEVPRFVDEVPVVRAFVGLVYNFD